MARLDSAACAPCHRTERRKVWFVFDWPKYYADLEVSDPVSGTEVPWRTYMFMMAESYETVALEIDAGHPKPAGKALDDLRIRLGVLRGACDDCHHSPRRSILTADVLKKLDGLSKNLAAGNDPKRTTKGLDALGQTTCYACHLIHVPASDVQAAWLRAHHMAPR